MEKNENFWIIFWQVFFLPIVEKCWYYADAKSFVRQELHLLFHIGTFFRSLEDENSCLRTNLPQFINILPFRIV